METIDLSGKIEALLFAWGDPLGLEEIVKASGVERNKVLKAIEVLRERYEKKENGLSLLKINNKYQLTTKKEASQVIKKLITPERKKSLSRATLETLSIIVYKQPITKNEIERIRGVKSDRALGNLLDENLIIEKERLPTIGRPIVYATSEHFLKRFGYESLEELPSLENQKSSDPTNVCEHGVKS